VLTQSKFHNSSVTPPGISHHTGKEVKVLKPATSNKKLGKRAHSAGRWIKGVFKGLPLYSLTLEERTTCQSDCAIWNECYGNNMPFASRFDATIDNGELLMSVLEKELTKLDEQHKDGYSIRLHVLGDFFSIPYVMWWSDALEKHSGMKVYGYTHRTGDIGKAIDDTYLKYPGRFVIMQSDATVPTIRPIALMEKTPGSELLPLCPEQAGKVNGCLDCGLCTNMNIKGVKFIEH
jgi:hypothetical protein